MIIFGEVSIKSLLSLFKVAFEPRQVAINVALNVRGINKTRQKKIKDLIPLSVDNRLSQFVGHEFLGRES